MLAAGWGMQPETATETHNHQAGCLLLELRSAVLPGGKGEADAGLNQPFNVGDTDE